MDQHVHLVTGATGNAGRLVVEELLRVGACVRVGCRSPEAFSDDQRLQRARLDFLDPGTFRDAVQGVRSMFLVRPPAISNVKETLNPLIDEAIAAGVSHIVFLSVVGADKHSFIPHHGVEAHLKEAKIAWTLLRAGFFAQNLQDAYLGDIRVHDRLFVPAGRGPVAFVDLRDVARVGATAMTTGAHAREALVLTGPEAFTFSQVAACLTEALGRPIRYDAASIVGYMRHLRRRGMPWMQVIVQTVLHRNLRDGSAATVDPTLERVLDATPHSLRDYVVDYADLWKSSP